MLTSVVGEEKKSRFGGLGRRLGTVVNRRKSVQPPYDRKQSEKDPISSSNLGQSVMSNGDEATRPSPQRLPSRGREADPLGDVRAPSGPPPNRMRAQELDSVSEARDGGPSNSNLLQPGTQVNGIPQIQEPLQPQTVDPDEITVAGSSRPLPVRGSSRDAQAFSTPPPATDPISQAQQESAR